MERISEAITRIFGPLLAPIFHPMNSVLTKVYMPWAKMAALGLFIGAAVWVFTLNRDYVNLDAPSKRIWHDLRFWTIVSMLPHIIVYLRF